MNRKHQIPKPPCQGADLRVSFAADRGLDRVEQLHRLPEAHIARQHYVDIAARGLAALRHRTEHEGNLQPCSRRCERIGEPVDQAGSLAQDAGQLPMLTTTLELPANLKARNAPLAEAEGKTPHAWMVDALRAQVALADLRHAFVDDARRCASEVDAGGALLAMEDVAAYLCGRIAGSRPKRPAAVARGKGPKCAS